MYNFHDFPKPKSIECYNSEAENFLSFLENTLKRKDFSLYQIGEVGLPGVSDLDFIVFWVEKSEQKIILNKVRQFTLIDTPIFFPKDEDIQNFPYFTHHYEIAHRWGRKIENFYYWEDDILHAIYVWKVLFFSALRNLYPILYNKKIPVKKLLSFINDLRYPHHYLAKNIVFDECIDDFFIRWQDFRNTWFIHQDTEKLSMFLEESIVISWRFIWIWSDKYSPRTKEEQRTHYGRFPTVFLDQWSIVDFRKNTELYYERYWGADRFLVLPKSFDYQSWLGEFLLKKEKMLSLRPRFFPEQFSSTFLKGALLLKIIRDRIRITSYKKYEKA